MRRGTLRRAVHALTVVAWLIAAWVMLDRAQAVIHDPASGLDLRPLYESGVHLLHGRDIYTDRLFVYPATCAIAAVPMAWSLSFRHAEVLYAYFEVLAVTFSLVVAFYASRRLRWWGLWAALATIALMKGDLVSRAMDLENVSMVIVPLAVVAVCLAGTGRWRRSTGVLGLSLMMKPLLIPLLLVPVMARRWRESAVLVGGVLTAVLAVTVALGDLSRIPHLIGYLLNGSQLTGRLSVYNISLSGFGHYHRMTGPMDVVRLGVAGSLVWVLFESRTVEDFSGVVAVACSALLGVMLAGSLSENHYLLVVIPCAVLACLTTDSRPARVFFVAGFALAGYAGLYFGFATTSSGTQARELLLEILLYCGSLTALFRSSAALGRVDPGQLRRPPDRRPHIVGEGGYKH